MPVSGSRSEQQGEAYHESGETSGRAGGIGAGIDRTCRALASAAAATRFGGGEILWDTFGVPHVYARTEAGMFYGFGYAQAQSHGNLLLHIYGEAHAKAAEYWGPSYEKDDRWLIANDVPERSLAW
jgi:acyl-homoserine-lactone acylase